MNNNTKEASLRRSIIRTIAYYDIFNYPLTADEIYINLGDIHTSPDEIKKELSNLSADQLLFNTGDFFQLKHDNNHITRREKGNKLAEKRLQTARRMSGFISKFPFVRGIMLSGSLSKGFMEKDSDIDYFIITHPNRVWLTRLMLMLFKKIFMLNSKKMFCINYFVDAENLEIQEKNIFTATELVTLIPTYGRSIYDRLYEKNIWIKEFYPNFPKRNTINVPEQNNSRFSSAFEKLLSNKLGDRIDEFAMAMFQKFYRLKYKNYNQEEFKLAFKTTRTESKHHPRFFQKKVLLEFENKIKVLEQKYKISL